MRERDREKQTERQRDRETERQRDRETERQRNRKDTPRAHTASERASKAECKRSCVYARAEAVAPGG